MSRRDWTLFVADMQEAFSADTRTVDAVVRNLEIIGEAANSIPEDQKLLRPDIDWRAIRKLRNRIVHEYFGIDYEIVWNIIENDIDSYIEWLEVYLSDRP